MASWPGRKQTTKDKPHEVWKSRDGSWTWYVLKKHQADDTKPYARWFCYVTSPMTYGGGDMGDCYAADIMRHAVCVERNGEPTPQASQVAV